MRRTSAQIAADVVLALAKSTLSLSEVSDEVHNDKTKSAHVRGYVEELRTVGMVHIARWKRNAGEWVPLYHLSLVPFSIPDAPKPEGRS